MGDVMVDVLAQLPRELAVGSDTPSEITLLSGGSAANTASWLVVAGMPTTFVGRVGDDALGRKLLDEMAAEGIDLAVSVDPQLPTGVCIVLVAPNGERTMVPSAGANAVGGELPELVPGSHLHVSGYALFHPRSCAAATAALRTARAAGCTVSVDAASAAPLRDFGADAFLDAIGPVLLLANGDEAAALTGTTDTDTDTDTDTAARTLGARCGEAIVKCGARGAVWSDGTDIVREMPPPLVPFDSTGAGDAFAAGVLSARLSGAAVADALRAGNESSARLSGAVVADALRAGNELAARAIRQRGARPVV